MKYKYLSIEAICEEAGIHYSKPLFIHCAAYFIANAKRNSGSLASSNNLSWLALWPMTSRGSAWLSDSGWPKSNSASWPTWLAWPLGWPGWPLMAG